MKNKLGYINVLDKIFIEWLSISLISIFCLLTSNIINAQSLLEYQNQAANQNPGLQAKYKAFEAALERIPQVKSLPDPNFSFGYFISPVETRVGPQRARFSLTQMFPWFGTLKASGDEAALNAEAQYQSFLEARNKLYYQVAESYYQLLELERWLELEEDNIKVLESYKSISTSKFENGETPMADVLRVDILLKDAETNLEILQHKRRVLLTRFNKLLNRDELTEIILEESLNVLEIDFNKDSLISNNPSLHQLNALIDASKKQQELVEKQGLPKLGVGLDYVLVGERSDLAPPDNGKDALMPMLTVGLPIFRNKYNAAQKEAQLKQEQFILQKEEQVNRLITDFEMADFDQKKQLRILRLYEQQITETEQVLSLMFSAYSNSGENFDEVLRMKMQLLKYQKLKATAQVNHHISVAKLNYLTAKKH